MFKVTSLLIYKEKLGLLKSLVLEILAEQLRYNIT
jgi:hypothetical protein